jgi:hypothetical protein
MKKQISVNSFFSYNFDQKLSTTETSRQASIWIRPLASGQNLSFWDHFFQGSTNSKKYIMLLSKAARRYTLT